MKKFILISILIFLNGFIWAQDPFYRIIGKTDGLPSNSVYNIFQDSKGYIWCSHNEGLSRYDGFAFETFNSDKQSSKSGSYILEDVYGRIWYSNFDGYLYYVENDSLKELPMGSPYGFTRYGLTDKYVYVTVQNGVDVYELKSLKLVKSIPIRFKNVTSSITFNNKFYLINESVLIFEDLKPVKEIDITVHPEFRMGMNLFSYSNKEILFAQKENKGVHGLKIDTQNKISKVGFHFDGYFQNYSITDSLYWACSQNGVYGFDASKNSNLNNGKSFFNGFNISSVFRDNRGNFWFSTLSDGIIYVPNLNIKRIGMGKEKPIKVIQKDNGILIGTRSGSVLYDDLNGKLKVISKSNQHEITSLVYDAISKRILFNNKDFHVLDKNLNEIFYRHFSLKDVCRLDDHYYAYCFSGNLGLLNISGKPNGSVWDSLHFAKFEEDNPKVSTLGTAVIRGKSVVYDSLLNNIYFAGNLGLFIANPHGVKELKYQGKPFFIKRLQIGLNRVFCLNGNGTVFEIKAGKDIAKLETPGLVKDIKVCDGYLFLITDDKLFQIDLKNNDNKVFQIEYIASEQEINDIVYANNQLVIATNQGLVISNKNETFNKPYKAPFYIDKIKVGSNVYTPFFHKTFSSDNNTVSIHYAVLNYNKASDLPLYYRINGNSWIVCPRFSRNLVLPSLAPGDYEIEFRLGDFEPEKAAVRFSINRPYYLQWWFLFLFFSCLLGIIVLMYQNRVRRIKISNNLKLEKIELQKSLGQSMLTAIKSQMNPHFFYNALNTIQSFIYSDDKKKASNYLAKFSKLTRLILEMSEKETVSLADELVSLKLYLELEEVRFEETDFHYSLQLDPKIDIEMVQIPSMIIQPYVENAIKHGLLHKKGTKTLNIHIYQDIGILVVELDDNGVGREKSAKIKAGKNEKWTSFSSGANEKRLEILNRGRSRAIGVSITDKHDHLNESLGTLVKISIPLNN